MATKKSYTLSTGDTLTDVRDNTGNFSSATFAKLHIPEYKRTFDVTRNNYTGEVILARWWKIVDLAGHDREEAILSALRAFFDEYVPTRAH